eukprot:11419449-Alexandrium_andersonii.AAC.1
MPASEPAGGHTRDTPGDHAAGGGERIGTGPCGSAAQSAPDCRATWVVERSCAAGRVRGLCGHGRRPDK